MAFLRARERCPRLELDEPESELESEPDELLDELELVERVGGAAARLRLRAAAAAAAAAAEADDDEPPAPVRWALLPA